MTRAIPVPIARPAGVAPKHGAGHPIPDMRRTSSLGRMGRRALPSGSGRARGGHPFPAT